MNEKTPDFSITPLSILRDKRVTYRALKVYIAIRSFMNKETHECFPSRKLISYLADIPITRVSVETETLERLGWIQKTGKGGRSMSCTYKVFSSPQTVAESVTVTSLETVINSVTVTESETVTDLDETVTDLSGNGYRFGMETVINSVTGKEQTIEQTRNREEQTSAVACASASSVLFPEQPATKPHNKTKTKRTSQDNSALLARFDADFWPRYPLKVSKENARKAWEKLNPDNELIDTILTAISNQDKEKQVKIATKQFCPPWPHPATWLNSRRWEDEVNLVKTPTTTHRVNNNLAPGYKSVSSVGI